MYTAGTYNYTKHDQDVQPMPGLSTALLICSVTCNTHSFLKTTLLSHADGLTLLLTFVLLCSSTATFPVILNSMLPQLQPLQTCLMHAHPTTKYNKSFNTSFFDPATPLHKDTNSCLFMQERTWMHKLTTHCLKAEASSSGLQHQLLQSWLK